MYKDMLAVSIDDDEQNLMLVEVFAQEIGLETKSFSNPVEALEFLRNNDVDIVFVDFMMPQLDGITLIEEFRAFNDSTPIIMITGSANAMKTKMKALKAGSTDFLSKPLDLFEFTLRTKNLLNLRKSQILVRNKAKLLKREVEKATNIIIDREYEALGILGKAAEFRDDITAYHTKRVGHYSKILAQSCDYDEDFQEMIFYAAQLHDIGKIGITDNILLKPGKLTKEEFDEMKKHAQIGYDILVNSKSKYLRMGAHIALTHHEKYDGNGYPNALSEDLIPIEGRIVAIADCFDALNSKRPYKDAWAFEESFEYIKGQKGKHFDPNLVEIFVEKIDDIWKIHDTFADM